MQPRTSQANSEGPSASRVVTGFASAVCAFEYEQHAFRDAACP